MKSNITRSHFTSEVHFLLVSTIPGRQSKPRPDPYLERLESNFVKVQTPGQVAQYNGIRVMLMPCVEGSPRPGEKEF